MDKNLKNKLIKNKKKIENFKKIYKILLKSLVPLCLIEAFILILYIIITSYNMLLSIVPLLLLLALLTFIVFLIILIYLIYSYCYTIYIFKKYKTLYEKLSKDTTYSKE